MEKIFILIALLSLTTNAFGQDTISIELKTYEKWELEKYEKELNLLEWTEFQHQKQLQQELVLFSVHSKKIEETINFLDSIQDQISQVNNCDSLTISQKITQTSVIREKYSEYKKQKQSEYVIFKEILAKIQQKDQELEKIQKDKIAKNKEFHTWILSKHKRHTGKDTKNMFVYLLHKKQVVRTIQFIVSQNTTGQSLNDCPVFLFQFL